MEFKDKMKYLRTKHGYTQTELASRIGVTQPALCAYESGEAIPSIENGLKLARIFNVTLDDLVNNEKNII